MFASTQTHIFDIDMLIYIKYKRDLDQRLSDPRVGATSRKDEQSMEDLISQLLGFAKGIWKYRFWAIATAWLVLLGGAALVYAIPAQYNSTARVFVDTASILKPLLAGMTTVPDVEQQVSIMSRTLITRPNVEKVIRMVDLDLAARTAQQHEAVVDDLMKNIKIAGLAQNDIYTISYNNPKPKVARDVVQALLTIFVEGSFSDKKQDSAKAVAFINAQIQQYEDKLTAAEAALKDFKLKNMGLLPRQGSDYGAKLADTADVLGQARLELSEAEQSREALARQIAAIPAGAMADTPAGAPLMSETDARILALRKNLDAMRLQYTEQHPDILAAKKLLAELEANKRQEQQDRAQGGGTITYSPILQQMKMALASADAHVAALRARVAEYAARNAHLTRANLEAPAIEEQFAQLNRDYTVNKENYEKLVASRESAKLSGELSASTEMMTFRVIDPPTLPLQPSGQNRVGTLSLVLAAALAAGALAGIAMNMLRPTFVSTASLRDTTALPVIGSVGLFWTPLQRQQRRSNLLHFGGALLLLLVVYGGLMIPILRQS